MGFVYTPAIPVAGTFVGAWEFSPNHLAPYSALAVYKSGAPVLVDDTAPLPVMFASAQHVIIDSATLGTVTVTGTLAATQSGTWSVGITGQLPAFSSPPAVTASWATAQHVIVDSVTGSVTVANPTDVTALATHAKQDTTNTKLDALAQLLAGGLPALLGTAGGLKSSLVDLGGAATEAAAQAILAKLTSDPATAALQGTGNTALANILAKLIAAPATEAKQDTGNTSLSALANLISAGRLAVTLGSAVANGGSLPSLINVVAGYDGASVRALKTAASGALDVLSNGANIATQTTLAALLTSISDGTLRGITAEKGWTAATGSTLATAGQQIVSGACVVRALWMFNNTGASVIIYLADRTSTIANGTIPAGSGGGMGCTGTLGTGGPVNGIPTGMALEGGIPFANGLWAQASSTISTMTSQGSTAVYWVCLYRAGTGL